MATQQKTYELVVQHRELLGKKSKALRRQGALPGVVYGHGIDPMPVQVDQKELERVFLRTGSNALVDLKVGDGAKAQKVFIYEVKRDPVTHNPQHVDFMVVNLREEVTTSVPLVLVGESPAVKANEGMLMHPIDHVQIRALPTSIPPFIEADISGLENVDDSILVSDLTIPEDVTLLSSGDDLVAKITALRVEEVEEVEAAEEGEEEAEGAEEAEGEEPETSEDES
jgi:large subunit ribosomal protein L25